jgi:hypothetical protein
MTKEYLVTLNVNPALEEVVVDCLLTMEFERGFCSFPLNAHHHDNLGLSLSEQVSGRQKKIRFQLYVNDADLTALLTQLRAEFSGSAIQYWVQPVVEHGVL